MKRTLLIVGVLVLGHGAGSHLHERRPDVRSHEREEADVSLAMATASPAARARGLRGRGGEGPVEVALPERPRRR